MHERKVPETGFRTTVSHNNVRNMETGPNKDFTADFNRTVKL